MFEYLAVLVANGTTFGPDSYHPALPFYGFGWFALVASIILFWGFGVRGLCVFGASTAFSLMGVFIAWLILTLDPFDIFFTWVVLFGVISFNLTPYLRESSTHKAPMPP